MISLSTIRIHADLHLLVEHEYSSYGSRIKDEAVAFDEARTLVLFIVMNATHSCWAITLFAIFFPGEPHQPNGCRDAKKVRKYLFKILID